MNHLDENKFSFTTLANQELTILLHALNLTKAGLVITDCSQPDDPILYCNAAFENLSGYTREEVIGRNCRFLQGTDNDNREERRQMRTAIQNGDDCTVEIRNYRKDGTPFWNDLHLKAIKDEQNKPVYYIGVLNDISPKRLRRERLELQKLKVASQLAQNTLKYREPVRFLDSILETINESFLIMNEDWVILQVNHSFLKVFHLAEEEVLNKNLLEIQQGRWNFMALKNLLTHLSPQKNHIKNYPLEHTFFNVGKKMLNINAHLVQGEQHNSIVLAIEDITEISEIERRKDDFLNIASHELKTPLTTIKSSLQFAQRMLTAENNNKLKETLEKAKIYVDKLENLVADLLDVSKIKTGEIELSSSPFNLDDMIIGVVDQLKAIHSRIKFNIHGFASNYYIGDKNRLEQVVKHLLKNSIKFSPQEGQIDIHLARLSDYIKIAVTDNGLGVAHQYQKKIFENFFRVDEIQKQFAGIGSGLYLSDQIIRNHGGTLWVESKIGEGATFAFTLPLKRTTL